jgi:hypothetical protein
MRSRPAQVAEELGVGAATFNRGVHPGRLMTQTV